MSTTPRTDAHIDGLRRDPEVSGCDRTLNFCRQLERELNAAKAEANNQSTLALMFIDRALKAEAEIAAAIKKSDTKDEIIHLMRDQLEKAETRLDVMIARAEKAEAKLAEMSSIAVKWEDDALRYARNAEYWQSRVEKADAYAAKAEAYAAVRADVYAATKNSSK